MQGSKFLIYKATLRMSNKVYSSWIIYLFKRNLCICYVYLNANH